MRLLLLITDLQIGGTPTVVRELAIRLRRRGADVRVACLAGWGPMADELTAAGVSVMALGARGSSDLGAIIRLRRLIRDERIDTVWAFLVHAATAAVAVYQLDERFRLILAMQTAQPHPRWHWWLWAALAPAADGIIVPTQSVAQAAVERSFIPKSKITVIPNAIDPADFVSSPIPKIDPRPYPVGFIGRLDPVKRVPALVRAVARLRGLVHLHIFGEGPDRPAIEAEVRRTGAAATLHGTIPRPQAALSQIGLLVLPSVAEGFGLVLIEAMATGVPVIGADAPGIRDVIRHDYSGLLVLVDDDAALAAAILRIINDPPLRRRLIEGGLADVRRRYTWDSVLPMYEAL